MKLKLGFSTCPNDTFIFDAMVHHKIDTEGVEFEYFMGDVEELNKMAFSGAAHITKISFNAFTKLANDYVLLDSGAALGENCGPLIIAASDFPVEELNNKKIAVPGFNTTANLLMEYAFPKAVNKVEMLFSDIENAVAGGRVDAGLIIHESRFTYAQKGLVKLADVGEIWEKRTGTPTPLGGIIAKRSLGEEMLRKINRIMRRSVEYAFENPKSSLDFIRANAQEMDEEVMYKHIELYVNNYTLSLGEEGRRSVNKLFEIAGKKGNEKNFLFGDI